MPAAEQRGPDRDGGRRRAGRDALPARRVARAAAVPARGAAVPQGRPDLVVRRGVRAGCATSTGTPCAGSTCAAPGRRRATRTDEYPAAEQQRPRRGDRLAGRAGVVRRQRRHVRHVVLRLQLAADRVRAAAGAEGGRRDLRQRRPLDRRRALAGRRAAAGRPRRLLPLHDADVRAAARARGVGRAAGGRSGSAGWRPTSRGC